jgi:hypothetical protein
VQALVALAGAATASDVCRLAVDGAVALTGARAGALGVRRGRVAELVASAGYDCDVMDVGARLPLDAGLPLTESVRTGRTVVRGAPGEPGWIALPVRTADVEGALLVSLTPGSVADETALRTLAEATSAALSRCAERPPTDGTAGLWQPPGWLEAAAFRRGADGPGEPSGDLLALLPGAHPEQAWLVVADVCGSGAVAAPTASVLGDALTTLAPADLAPTQLLEALDRVLHRDTGDGPFVTAMAARLRRLPDGVAVALATAGHPPALLRRGGVVAPVTASGRPLRLDVGQPVCDAEARFLLHAGELAFGYTDGLVDRRRRDRTDDLVAVLGVPTASAAETIEAVARRLVDFDRVVDDVVAVAVTPAG